MNLVFFNIRLQTILSSTAYNFTYTAKCLQLIKIRYTLQLNMLKYTVYTLQLKLYLNCIWTYIF